MLDCNHSSGRRVARRSYVIALLRMPESRRSAMAIDQVDRTVVTQTPSDPANHQSVSTDTRRTSSAGPGASELTRRVIVLLFGLIQIVIGARFVLLLLDAREANGLVAGVLNLSPLVDAPFDGILPTKP